MQFPQPTRPIGSFDANCDTFLQDSQDSSNFLDSNFFHLSQPPLSFPTTINSEYFDAENNVPEEILQFQFYDNTYPHVPREGEQVQEKDSVVEELINVLSVWYKKLPESIRRQLNVKKLNENITIPRGSARGIQVQELLDKLERFKVRIVSQDDTIKTDQDQNTK